MKSNIGRSMALAILLACLCLPAAGAESGPRTVRVGYFDYEGFLEQTADGGFTGYGADYLEEISSYLGWRYEYVYGSWEECLDRLAEGEIDLLCTAQYSEERAARYDYAKYASGVEYATLLVAGDNQTVFYGDCASFDGLRVGFMKDSHQNDLFEDYARANGFHCRPVYYDTAKALQRALDAGEIDAMLTGSLQKITGYQAVAKISPEPFYFITTKGSSGLMDELNGTLEAIQTADTDFNGKLYDKYYGEASASQLAFTREEAALIRAHPTLRAAYCDGWHPLSYTGGGNRFSGICAGVMELLSQRSGIQFEYIPAAGEEEALALLSAGEVDLICPLAEGPDNPVLLTKPILEARISLSMPDGLTAGEVASIAVPNRPALLDYARALYPQAELLPREDAEACLEAVRRGKADAALENAYLLNQYAKDSHFSGTAPVYGAEGSLPLRIGLREDANPALRSLLNKLISQITDKELDYILMENTSEGPHIHIDGWLRRYLGPIVFAAALLLLLFLFYSSLRVRRYALTDPLTGYGNLSKFLLAAEKLEREEGYSGHVIVSFDIDKFKFLNNLCGFQTGNQVLREISVLLSRRVERGELFCREANDHFFLLLRAGGPEELRRRLAGLVGEVSSVPSSADRKYTYTVSCGVYLFQAGERDIHQAIGWANLARERAKPVSRDWIVFYDDSMRRETLREQEITNRMEAALRDGEFTVFYQPKVRLADERVVGAEALARWITEDGTAFSPDEFIPVFERNGFITRLDPYIFERVCRQLRKWLDAGVEACPVSVNLSRVHLSQPNFYLRYLEIMERYRIDPGLIELEITEGTILESKTQVASLIGALKGAHIQTSIDDFGSGYSSLNFMKDLPFDYLKLDKEFFNVSSDSKRGQEIIRSVIEMAGRLHMTVVAEGVETQEQVDFLKKIHCDIVQGYYYSKPLPPEGLEQMLGGHGGARPGLGEGTTCITVD